MSIFFSVDNDELISMEPHWQHIMWRTSAQIDEFTHHISLKCSQWNVLHPPKFSVLTLHIYRNAPLDTSRFLNEKASGFAGPAEDRCSRSAEFPLLVSILTGLCQRVREDGVIDFFIYFLVLSFQVTALSSAVPPLNGEMLMGRPNTFKPSY